MKVYETDKIKPGDQSVAEKLYVYNGLDCCLTFEVKDAILPLLDNHTKSTYNFSKELQGPVLDMDLRGIKIDEASRQIALQTFTRRLQHLEANFNTILREGLGHAMNWNSPAQVCQLLYEVLRIPIYRSKKGTATADRKTLEKIRDAYFYAEPLIRHILAMREFKKCIGTLKTRLIQTADSDPAITSQVQRLEDSLHQAQHLTQELMLKT
jgi:DNA polymerase I-like protein with 3'-5' exonuclease and polymerase domains